MALETRNRRFHRLGALAVAALGLGALALPLTPAQAQIGFGCGPYGCGIGIGPVGVGVGSPYYADPYYYGYAPYSRPHYYYAYYRGLVLMQAARAARKPARAVVMTTVRRR